MASARREPPKKKLRPPEHIAARDQLKQQTCARARQNFRELVGEDYDPVWGAKIIGEYKRLKDEEELAHRTMREAKHAPHKTRRIAEQHHAVRSPYREGLAPAMSALGQIIRRDRLKRFTAADDPIASKKFFSSLDAYVVARFGELPVDEVGPSPPIVWRPRRAERRVLTNLELAAIRVCLEPARVKVKWSELDAKWSAAQVLNRIASELDKVRRTHGDQLPPQSRAERAAEKSKGYAQLPMTLRDSR